MFVFMCVGVCVCALVYAYVNECVPVYMCLSVCVCGRVCM